MAIEERTRPYETLIRHHPDGSIGAHHKRINEIVRDGVVLAASEGIAESIAGAGLDVVLGQAAHAALVQAEQVTAENVRLVAQIKSFEEKHQREIEDLKGQLGASQDELSTAKRHISEMEAKNLHFTPV